jgi:hypothetical protein
MVKGLEQDPVMGAIVQTAMTLGRQQERRAILAMIRDRDGAYYSRESLAVAEAIEAGEHLEETHE